MSINLDRLTFLSLCIFAFLIPFEQILKTSFGIDTVLKPYRMAIIVAVGFYGLKVFKEGLKIGPDIKEDWFFYLIFIYGIGVSLVQMVISPFSLGKFYNDLFLVVLNFPAFFIIKNTRLSQDKIIVLTQWLIAGIFLNSVYVFYNYYVLRNFGRQAGFMDNPNYLALSIVIAITFILYRVNLSKWLRTIGQGILVMVMVYTFLIAGSRGGLIALVAVLGMTFWFASVSRKVAMSLAMIGILVFFIPSLNSGSSFEGETPLVLVNRVNEIDVTEDPRIAIWLGTIRASESTFYMGLGIGQFKARFTDFYQGETNSTIYEVVDFGYHLTPHSDYFGILVTYGIIGLVLYLAFLFFTTQKKRKQIRFAASKSLRDYHQFTFTLLVTIILFGVVADSFNSPLYWILLAISTKTPN